MREAWNRRVRVVSGLVLVGAGSALAAQPDASLPAPYQVQAVVRDVDTRDAPGAMAAPRVMIDLGTAEQTAWPDRDRPQTMTLIGTAGAMRASLEDVVKVCETLCGDEHEECHFEGVLVPAGDLAAIGTPVAALPDEYRLSDFDAIATTPDGAALGTALSDVLVHPIWPDENPGDQRHRFVRSGDGLTLEYVWGSSGGQRVPLGSCRFHDRGPLTRVACGAVEALLADGVPLLVSFPDYNSAGADLVASFIHADQAFYVVRLALKVQTIYGLIFRDSGGTWHARFHPRDYSLLC